MIKAICSAHLELVPRPETLAGIISEKTPLFANVDFGQEPAF